MGRITYEGLYQILEEKNLTKTAMAEALGISSRTIAKLSKGEKLSKRTLQKIADFLSCNTDELYRVISENRILQILRDEKEARISGGLYHELQVRMAYHSNHMEGSRLSEEETRQIFETKIIQSAQGVPVDDILETVHHFQAVDYVIDIAEQRLNETIIKHLHYLLKHDTSDSRLSWFAVGDYKRMGNMVGGVETAKPEEVSDKMKELLHHYNQHEAVTINNSIAFHVEFERIHPFQDGNGRVGRLIILKECLKYSIIPFIIEDSKNTFIFADCQTGEQNKAGSEIPVWMDRIRLSVFLISLEYPIHKTRA